MVDLFDIAMYAIGYFIFALATLLWLITCVWDAEERHQLRLALFPEPLASVNQ